jgi:hypothetical protein
MRSATLLGSLSLSTTLIGFVTWLAALEGGAPLRPAEGKTTDPQLESKVEPVYPPEARDAELEANVVLQAIIRKDGSVDGEGARCLQCSVRRKGGRTEEVLRGWCDDFCDASIEAAAQWHYTPGTVNGEPVDVYFAIVLDFVLQ